MSYLVFLFLSLAFLKVTGLASMSLLVMFSPILFIVTLIAGLFIVGVGVAAVEHISGIRRKRRG